MSADSTYRYPAFISYAHRDERWAVWLHRALERYRLPRKLRQQGRPAHLFPIFRDRDELSASGDLNERINEALKQSRTLIVVCSPHAVASRWVEGEIAAFKAMGGEGRVLCLIVDGEPNSADPEKECFPRAIRFRVDASGAIGEQPAEHIAADARPGKDGRENALLKLIAGILQVPFDEVRRRELLRKRRFWTTVGAGMTILSLVLLALTIFAFTQQQIAQEEAAKARAVNDFLLNMLSSANPEFEGRDVKMADVLAASEKTMSERFRGKPELEAVVRAAIGTTWVGLGLYEPAAVQLQLAHDIWRETGRLDERDALIISANLAQAYNKLGRYAEAEALLRDTIPRATRVLGPDHDDTLSARSNLALTLDNLGRFEEAEALQKETWEARKRVFGAASPEALNSRMQIAGYFDRRADHVESAKIYREVLLGLQRALGAEHPQTLTAMSNLAYALFCQGKYGEAETLTRQVLENRRRILGPEHPETLATMSNLATTLAKNGEVDAAEKILREVVAIDRRSMGDRQPELLSALGNLAGLSDQLGNRDEARQLYEEILQTRRDTLGDSHPDTVRTLELLAELLSRMNDFEAAAPLQRELLDWRTAHLGAAHADTFQAMSDLAFALFRLGRLTEAGDLVRDGIAIAEKELGQEDEHAKRLRDISAIIDGEIAKRNPPES